ncbi:MAG: N-acetylneuraminate synthase family protein [Vicingaceae bacterium]
MKIGSFLKQFQFGNLAVGEGNPPYIIAEMACAHDGDFEKAKKLVDASAEAGANATQFQIFDMEHVVTPKNDIYETLANITFTKEQWKELEERARKKGLDVFVCTYDVPSVELAKYLNADGIKLNSADLSNPDVIKAVSESGIPFTLGTGASTLEEIYSGLQNCASHGANKVVLMHGVQNFPTQIDDLNISRLSLLKDVFGLPVGYQDHVDGENPFGKVVDLIAIGIGVQVLEKHITIDRSEKGLDYQAALEPKEFKAYCELVKKGYAAFGNKQPKPFTPSELKYRKFQKKSIVAMQNLKVGDVISRDKVHFSRNNEPGIPPNRFSEIEGMKVVNPIDAFDNINPSDLS